MRVTRRLLTKVRFRPACPCPGTDDNSTEAARQARLNIAKTVIELLKTKSEEDVLEIMAGLVEQTKNMQVIQKLAGPVPNRMGPTLPSILSGNTHNADNHVSPAGNQYVPISQQLQRTPLEPPTQASGAVQHPDFHAHVGVDGKLYVAMPESSKLDELNQSHHHDAALMPPPQTAKPTDGMNDNNQQQAITRMTSSLTSTAGETEQTPEPKQRKKRASPHPRCEECKTKRKRCNHIIPDSNAVRHETGTDTNTETELMHMTTDAMQTAENTNRPEANMLAAMPGMHGTGFPVQGSAAHNAWWLHNANTFATGAHGHADTATSFEPGNLTHLLNAAEGLSELPTLGDGSIAPVTQTVDPMHVDYQVPQQHAEQQLPEHITVIQPQQQAETVGAPDNATDGAPDAEATGGEEGEKVEPKKRGRPKRSE